MQNLPQDMIIEFLINLSITDIRQVAMINKRLNQLSNNPVLWYRKFNRDYNAIPWNYDTDWQNLYINYNNLYQINLIDYEKVSDQIPIDRLGNYKAKQISESYFIDLEDNVYEYDINIQSKGFKAKSIKNGPQRDLYIDLDDYVNEIYQDKNKRLGNWKVKQISIGS